MSKLNKKLTPCFFLTSEEGEEHWLSHFALAVTFLQAKNTQVRLGTYASTLLVTLNNRNSLKNQDYKVIVRQH